MRKLARIGGSVTICLGLAMGIVALIGTFSSAALISAGPSRKLCVYPLSTNGDLQPGLSIAENAMGASASCVSDYFSGAVSWAEWENPWVSDPQYGLHNSWVAADPTGRQLILQVDLIPQSLEDQSDPSGWEQACASGQFNSYAERLGRTWWTRVWGIQSSGWAPR